MATMYATNSPVEAIAPADVDEMGSRRISRPTSMNTGQAASYSSASPRLSPKINLPPPPNPPFVFPARPLSSSSSTTPSSLSRASVRRPHSVNILQDPVTGFATDVTEHVKRSPALPDFSFNPGATLGPEAADRRAIPSGLPDFSFNPGAASATDTSRLSPPISPDPPPSPRTVPTNMGHRRGGSEFVGGQLRSGEPITVMNPSPTNTDGGYASSPRLTPANVPGPRRGHAHRRSGAISHHDLTEILQRRSPNPSRGSSAPGSPSFAENKLRGPESNRAALAEAPKIVSAEEAANEKILELPSRPPSEPSPRPTTRARVGFSDTLEFIPRPLSLVSTDTSSTVTGRLGHSVSDSITSIISMSNSLVTERDTPSVLGSPVPSTVSNSRPSTAGAILERTPTQNTPNENSLSPRRRNSIPLLTELSPEDNSNTSRPVPSPIKTPKRWSFFGLEALAAASSPTRGRPVSSDSSAGALKTTGSPSLSAADSKVESNKYASGPDGKKSSKKKQKKVKKWAGSILTRKSKSRSHKVRRRSSTPPTHRMSRDEASENGYMSAPMITVYPSSDSETSKPTRVRNDDDASYPMIDLDAALGPFNTPSRDLQWEEAQRAGAPPKRQLHSAAGMRGFSGPGMHYHRRAESAPEMPPFEAGRFGIHRFGSSSTMADVFEEDEEDEDDQGATSPSESSSNDGQDPSVEGSDDGFNKEDVAATPTHGRDFDLLARRDSSQSTAAVKRKGSGSSLELQRPGSRMRTENPSGALQEEVIAEEGTTQHYNAIGLSPTVNWGHSDSTAPSSPCRLTVPVDATPAVAPSQSAVPASPYSTSHASSFPSPRSPMSYDAHRISTAASSVADENNFQSLLMGEPGPEVVRISVDVDVPSLTSSNSTMTRESASAAGVRPRNTPFHEQRPASFTASAFGRRRSSLASLSRLISSAHGERSKLSTEVPCESEPERKEKNSSRSKRLSRMMQFWRPKSSGGS